MKKNRTLRFFIALLIVLAILGSIGIGGFFLLDRVIVPKYFSAFGINNMADLSQVMSTLYASKDESNLVSNGFSNADLSSAESKLISVGFPTLESGKLDYKAIADGDYTLSNESKAFTDKELASVLNGMLGSGILAERLNGLQYINTLNMELLEVIIKPKIENGELNPNSAKMEFMLKLNTTGIKTQMADEMQMPLFLLNMIIPKTLYIEVNFNLDISGEQWQYSNSTIGVNGRTSTQSEILLNLLINFIFPAEDNMNLDGLNTEFGKIVLEGINLLGDIKFTNEIYATKQNGVIITFK
ncbi:MAG: hypothetical protein IJS68_00300 [Clostridia bacterium]|nr:hypothetical protein [Clostridia bacterium]